MLLLLRVILCTLCLGALAAPVAAQPRIGAAPASAPVELGTRDPERMPMRLAPPRSTSSRAIPEPTPASTVEPTAGAPSASAKPGSAPAAALPAATPDAESKVDVKGLTGTLNKGDVHQTMEQHQREFDRCIVEGQRSLRYVSGAMQFGFRVDGTGRIADWKTLSSTVGHRGLEQCLTARVAATQFPRPAGRATATFSWGLRVEPAGARELESGKPKLLRSLVRKQARSVFSECEIKRRRARFKITAYVAPGGRVVSAGAVPQPQAADDKVDCVLEQVGKWHMPKVKKATKFTFDLR